MYNYMERFGSYHYIYYNDSMYIMANEEWEDYEKIEKEDFDPFKFSIAVIMNISDKANVRLINTDVSNILDVGIKRDWTELKETIDEGLRLMQKTIDLNKNKRRKMKGNKQFVGALTIGGSL